MSILMIFLAVIGIGFLGILAGAACMMSSIYSQSRGCCEECGKGCETINIYCGENCALEICECECDDDEDISQELQNLADLTGKMAEEVKSYIAKKDDSDSDSDSELKPENK